MPENLDCLTCGACCRTGHDGRILVPEEDLVRWRRIGRLDLVERLQPGHFGEMAFATDESGACVHLGVVADGVVADGSVADGSVASKNACSIYDIRGTTCREFERGSRQCLEFRRDFDIDSVAIDTASE